VIDGVEPGGAAVEVVVQTSGGGDDDLRAPPEGFDLRTHADAADHDWPRGSVGAEPARLLVDLERQRTVRPAPGRGLALVVVGFASRFSPARLLVRVGQGGFEARAESGSDRAGAGRRDVVGLAPAPADRRFPVPSEHIAQAPPPQRKTAPWCWLLP